jgi:type IV pilus assembly protein PilW
VTFPRARRARGFTLIELMVGAVISIITLGAIAASFAAVQGTYQAEVRIKSSVEGARSALGYLEHMVTLAGYGIDPRYAISTTTPTGGLKNNETLVAFAAGPPVIPQVATDDLLFRYRDLTFMLRGRANATTVTLDPTYNTQVGVPLRAGQLLQLSCPGASQYVGIRVASNVAATSNTIPLGSGATNFAYFSKDATPLTPSACLTNNTDLLYVTLVHEERVRIKMLGTAPNRRPYLVVFHNANDDVGTGTNYDPIAADVESFQVTYMMNRPPVGFPAPVPTAPDPGNTNWIFGDFPADGLPVTPANTANGTLPGYDTAYMDPLRFNNQSANVRAVRVTVVVRSNGTDPRRRTAFPPEPIEDFVPTSVAADGYYRTRATSIIRIPNMMTRSAFTPPLKDPSQIACPAVGCVDLNVGGG